MKKQIKISILLFLLPLLLLGQNKFSLGFNLSSEMSVMKIQESKVTQSTNGIEEEGSNALGFAIGTQLQYDLSNKLFLRSGLNYEQSNHRYLIKGLRFGLETTSTIENNISISSMSIPFDLGYRIPTNNANANILLGLGGLLHVNLNNKSSLNIHHNEAPDENLTDPNSAIEQSIYSLKFFAGVELKLSDNLKMTIEPHLKYTPNQFTLYLYESKASTLLETGLTVRINIK